MTKIMLIQYLSILIFKQLQNLYSIYSIKTIHYFINIPFLFILYSLKRQKVMYLKSKKIKIDFKFLQIRVWRSFVYKFHGQFDNKSKNKNVHKVE